MRMTTEEFLIGLIILVPVVVVVVILVVWAAS
jgi:hypothetical protein